MTKRKKKSQNLESALQQIQNLCTEQNLDEKVNHRETKSSLVFSDHFDADVLEKWPKPSLKVPDIFLHKPIDFAKHARKLLAKEINFYHPLLGRNFTRITCQTFEDHKAIVQYFDKRNLPYHTYGRPSKRKMKVVIRGLTNISEDKLKEELKTSIPVVRIHRMLRHRNDKDNNPIFMAVVPNDEKGRRMLLVKQIFGRDIKMEPINEKTNQCYRCQMWGHSQRYCHGEIKCVKCAGNHLSKKCDRSPEDPVKCANCGLEGHVASFRDCSRCPDSAIYKLIHPKKAVKERDQPILVTVKTCSHLYGNVKYE